MHKPIQRTTTFFVVRILVEIRCEFNTSIICRKLQSELPSIMAKLIVSINRSESIESAVENIALAVKYAKLHPNIICGVDLSGVPTSKTFEDFEPALRSAKQAGLKLALHCGEVDNPAEIKAMLEFGMHRLGHGTFVTGNVRKIESKT